MGKCEESSIRHRRNGVGRSTSLAYEATATTRLAQRAYFSTVGNDADMTTVGGDWITVVQRPITFPPTSSRASTFTASGSWDNGGGCRKGRGAPSGSLSVSFWINCLASHGAASRTRRNQHHRSAQDAFAQRHERDDGRRVRAVPAAGDLQSIGDKAFAEDTRIVNRASPPRFRPMRRNVRSRARQDQARELPLQAHAGSLGMLTVATCLLEPTRAGRASHGPSPCRFYRHQGLCQE